MLLPDALIVFCGLVGVDSLDSGDDDKGEVTAVFVVVSELLPPFPDTEPPCPRRRLMAAVFDIILERD